MGDKKTVTLPLARSFLRTAGFFLAIGLAGAIFTGAVVMRADRELRAELLAQTRLVTQSLNAENILALSGTAADIDKPEYVRLKEQLASTRAASPKYRFAYLMGRRDDGKVFFFVDSEPDGSKDGSPPGQVYDEASREVHSVFTTRDEFAEGPYADRWGTWVSALVPVNDTATGLSGLILKDDAKAIVHEAAYYYRKHGREQFLKEVSDPFGKFHKGSLYVFVYDLGMTMLAHPVKPELVGQNLIDKKDWSGGKYFRQEIQQVARTKGSGWVDYQYGNPVNKKIQPKTTYVDKVDDMILCAGAYKGTGDMLAVMGLDVDARTWAEDVAARAALPVGMMVLLIIGVASAIISNRRVEASAKPVLQQLLLPLMIMIFSMTLGALGLLWHQNRQNLNSAADRLVAGVAGNLRAALKEEGYGLTVATHSLVADARIQKGLQERDADGLLHAWKPVFEALHRDYGLTQVDFLDKDRVCLVRIHEPEKRGDRIDRATAMEAQRTGKAASGIEMEPSGRFILRVVQPLFDNGTLVGYVELGKEIDDVFEEVHASFGADLAVIVPKEHLDRLAWQDSRRILGRDVAWDRLPASAEVFTTLGRLPEAFLPWVRQIAADQGGSMPSEVSFDGKDWRLSASRLQDASGADAADLVIIHNISDEKKAFVRLLTLGGVSCVVVLALLLGIIYVLLHRTDAGILAQQKELSESEAKYRLILDNSSDLIWSLDPEGIITYASISWRRLTGYEPRDIIGKHFQVFVHEDDVPVNKERMAALLQAKTSALVPEYRVRHADGSWHWHAASVAPVLGPSGDVVSVVGISRDISEQKKSEEAISRMRVKLVQSDKLATLGEMATGMAHEINQPLNAIGLIMTTFRKLMQKKVLTEEKLEEGLRDIDASVRRMTQTIKHVRAYARQEVREFEKISVAETVDASLVLLGEQLRVHGIEVVKAIEPGLPLVRGEPHQLEQVWINFITNARDAMDEKEALAADGKLAAPGYRKVLNISVSAQAATHEVLVAFADNGVGVSGEQIKKAFDPFFTTKEVGKGTGLGLSISHGIIQGHKGRIEMEGRPGEGATLKVYLPAV